MRLFSLWQIDVGRVYDRERVSDASRVHIEVLIELNWRALFR